MQNFDILILNGYEIFKNLDINDISNDKSIEVINRSLNTIIKYEDKVIKYLDSSDVIVSSKKNILQAWLSCMKGLGVSIQIQNLYKDDLQRYRLLDREARTYQEATEKEKENNISMKELIDAR